MSALVGVSSQIFQRQEQRRLLRLQQQRDSRAAEKTSRRLLFGTATTSSSSSSYGADARSDSDSGSGSDDDPRVTELAVGDVGDGEGETTIEYSPQQYAEFNRIAKRKYLSEVCAAEPLWRGAVPADLEENWLCSKRPAGRQVVVKHGPHQADETSVFCAVSGQLLHSVHTNLPASTVLEAYLQTSTDHSGLCYHRLHILDCMCYRGRWMSASSFALREFWLRSQFDKDELRVLEEPSLEQAFSLSLVSTVDCALDSLLCLYVFSSGRLPVHVSLSLSVYFVPYAFISLLQPLSHLH